MADNTLNIDPKITGQVESSAQEVQDFKESPAAVITADGAQPSMDGTISTGYSQEDIFSDYHAPTLVDLKSQSLDEIKRNVYSFLIEIDNNETLSFSIARWVSKWISSIMDDALKIPQKPTISELNTIFLGIADGIDEFCKNNHSGNEEELSFIVKFLGTIDKTLSSTQSKIQDAEERSNYLKAIDQGALVSMGERIEIVTDPEFEKAFVSSISPNSKTGFYYKRNNHHSLALNINKSFLRYLGQAVAESGFSEEVQIYIPTILSELSLDPRGKGGNRKESRKQFVDDFIADLDDIWGKLPNDKIEYKFASVHSYDSELEVLAISPPYLLALARKMAEKENRLQLKGQPYFGKSYLLHSSAANERNQAALEMAEYIIAGLAQRGLTPDSKLKQNKNVRFKPGELNKVTYTVTAKGIISECPQIREKIKEQSTTNAKTQTIKRAFTAMYRILKTKTDLDRYYSNLKIFEVTPSYSTLGESKIVVEHYGKNSNFK